MRDYRSAAVSCSATLARRTADLYGHAILQKKVLRAHATILADGPRINVAGFKELAGRRRAIMIDVHLAPAQARVCRPRAEYCDVPGQKAHDDARDGDGDQPEVAHRKRMNSHDSRLRANASEFNCGGPTDHPRGSLP